MASIHSFIHQTRPVNPVFDSISSMQNWIKNHSFYHSNQNIYVVYFNQVEIGIWMWNIYINLETGLNQTFFPNHLYDVCVHNLDWIIKTEWPYAKNVRERKDCCEKECFVSLTHAKTRLNSIIWQMRSSNNSTMSQWDREQETNGLQKSWM